LGRHLVIKKKWNWRANLVSCY